MDKYTVRVVKAVAKLLTNALKKMLSAFDLPDQGSGVYTGTSNNERVKHREKKSRRSQSQSGDRVGCLAESQTRG